MIDILKAVAGPIVGGLFGKAAEDDRAESAARQQEQNAALQREFAQHGIRWRVEDAKAAGLHPLYAIGGSGASYAPNPVVVGSGPSAMAEMGQNVTRAAIAAADPHERALKEAQLRVLNAQASKDEALAAAAASNARVSSAHGTAAPIPLVQPSSVGDELDVGVWQRGRVESPENAVDTVRVKPDDITSVVGHQPFLTAAPNKPFYSEHRFSNDFRMLLPAGSSPSEAVEALGESPLTALMVVRHNLDHYGPGWGRQLAKQFPWLRDLVEAGEYLGQNAPVIPEYGYNEFSEHGHRESSWLNRFASRMDAARARVRSRRQPDFRWR